MKIRRPIVRYHGGKFLLADWIISHFPHHHGYVEPFGGGGSVLLKKGRCHFEVYNDLDGEIVNLFRCMRDNGERLRNLIRLTPYSRREGPFIEAFLGLEAEAQLESKPAFVLTATDPVPPPLRIGRITRITCTN